MAVSEAVAGLEPFVAWEQGRTALESLSVTALPAAAESFGRAVAGAPQYAPGFAGLANAHFFRYEASRVDNVPDLDALTAAVAAATRATQLDPSMGEGWAVLGHAMSAAGRVEDARAALRQAVALEPRNWRHHYRMAVCTWGEERLRAVERAEALLPGFPGAQTLAVMVLIARHSFDFAAEAAARGAAAQAAQADHTLYPASGLLWVRGLTAAARGDDTAALEDFAAEAALSRRTSTVYARECSVLAHEALGFTWLSRGDHEAGTGRRSRPRPRRLARARPGHRSGSRLPPASGRGRRERGRRVRRTGASRQARRARAAPRRGAGLGRYGPTTAWSSPTRP